MDLINTITTSLCECGNTYPVYVDKWEHAFCNDCVSSAKSQRYCHRVYRYMYAPVVCTAHVQSLFGVEHVDIRSYIHNGMRTCRLVPPEKKLGGTSLPGVCKRKVCTTPMDDHSKYCSVSCCIQAMDGDENVAPLEFPWRVGTPKGMDSMIPRRVSRKPITPWRSPSV